ncbi:MAG: hypothetical protein GC203_07520 [Phenylobacterium sp.]|uniref:immune inhibitor A domain-containing protein n=1 Tax=Phenylobacterium sp. TaxID=1871053 RepID=UPI0025F8CCEA|nr:immune inhibitor A domain-containing protein [Phenylobacterium sp.]MBI1197694.1 hypothetical protein [Phenylobacterium sp.]
MRPRIALIGAAVGAFASLAASGALAAEFFSQDFSGALGANESVFGRFVVHDGVVGHQTSYFNNEYSYYQFTVDLTNATSALLSFDYSIVLERDYDRFNVLASTGGFSPPGGLIYPLSGMTYSTSNITYAPHLGVVALADSATGTAVFDLGAFVGGAVNLRLQFGSDSSGTRQGVSIDNVEVAGDAVVTTSSAPEPQVWALMLAGFFAAGSALRRRGSIPV